MTAAIAAMAAFSWAYVTFGAAAVAMAVLARSGARWVAPFGRAVTKAMRHRSTRLGLVFAWWWFGWHFATGR